jgi:radical SAM protein with 4Fe4S-binding SPASM domain
MNSNVIIDHPYDPEKMLLYADKFHDLRKGNIVPPITVDVDLTEVCNHECPWCEYVNLRRIKPPHLSKDVVFRLLDDLSGSPVRGLIFSGGGEPTTYPYFAEVAHRVAANKLRAALYTHGGLIERHDTAIAESFVHVRVSLDAGSPGSHAHYHSGGDLNSFDQILNNLRILRKLKPGIRLEASFIVAEKNFTEISDLSRVLVTIPIDFFLIKFSRFASDNQWITSEKLKQIQAQVTEAKKLLHVYYRDPVLVEPVEFPVKTCRTTYLKAMVAPNGKLYICNQRRSEEKMAFGSLYEKGFWEIWESEEHADVYKGINTIECTPCRHIPYNHILDKTDEKQIPVIEVSEKVGELVAFL